MNPAKPILEEAWDNYYKTLNELLAATQATPRFRERAEHRAQAYHAVFEAQAMAYSQVIAPRQNQPRIYTHTAYNTYILSLGQIASDCRYSCMMLNGKQTYRLTGKIGDTKPTLVQVQSPMLGDANSKTIRNYNLNDLTTEGNPYFEVILSADEREGNWIPLEAGSGFNFVIIRRWFGDWYDDMGEMYIEMLDELEAYDESNEQAMAERINVATNYMAFLVKEFNINLYNMYIKTAGGRKNRFGYIGGEGIADSLIGSPSTYYGLAVADCATDEALIIEGTVPDSDYWGLQLGDVWSKPLDFMHYQTDINMQRVVIDSDGRYRVIVSHRDPGVPNWMNPLGRTEILIVMRNYIEVGKPRVEAPTVERVKFSQLHDYLPEETPTITPGQRKHDLQRRRRGFKRLYDY